MLFFAIAFLFLLVALELSWVNSKLWQGILQKINEKAGPNEQLFKPSIQALPPKPILSFQSDSDVTKSLAVYLVYDKSHTNKTGDIQMIDFLKTAENKSTHMIIECKNKIDMYSVIKETATFFENCSKRTVPEGRKEIYILLSLKDWEVSIFMFLFSIISDVV